MNTIDRLDPACWVPMSASKVARAGFPPRRWLARLWSRLTTSPGEHDELAELDAHTLADIGAPEKVLSRAMARRDAQRQERDGLRIGMAAGAWHHW